MDVPDAQQDILVPQQRSTQRDALVALSSQANGEQFCPVGVHKLHFWCQLGHDPFWKSIKCVISPAQRRARVKYRVGTRFPENIIQRRDVRLPIAQSLAFSIVAWQKTHMRNTVGVGKKTCIHDCRDSSDDSNKTQRRIQLNKHARAALFFPVSVLHRHGDAPIATGLPVYALRYNVSFTRLHNRGIES